MIGPVLDISGLTVAFPGLVRTTTVLRGVDLRIDPGDVLGLVGESGCGKSMTALACLGMVPAPGRVEGSLKVTGRELVGLSGSDLEKLRGGTVAMVFQDPMRSLNPFFTIGRQMTDIVRRHRPMSAADARRSAIEELRSVQLPDPETAMTRYPHQLSGGQIQRVMIALALACRPKLLIADEPTTALDVTIQAQIIALLQQLAAEKGLTVLFITHDLGVVTQLCNRVAVMYAGRVVESGSVEDIIETARHPYTSKLLSTVPTVGRGAQELDSIPGQVPNPRFMPDGCAFHQRCALATALCATAQPIDRTLAPGHLVACHHVEETPSPSVIRAEVVP